jgi:hypothetical protein
MNLCVMEFKFNKEKPIRWPMHTERKRRLRIHTPELIGHCQKPQEHTLILVVVQDGLMTSVHIASGTML